MYFVSSFFPIRVPGRYCIHNPNQSHHHCMNISRSLSKIVKYLCTSSTYIPPRVYVPVTSLLMKRLKSRLDQEKKDSHQTLKKEGSYSLPPPAEREGESLLPLSFLGYVVKIHLSSLGRKKK